MDPFGNFGWSFGFGFGWILIFVFLALMAVAIAQLSRLGIHDERRHREIMAEIDSLKQQVCANKISLEEFEDKIKTMV
jgi:cell division protein FtsL